MLGAQHRNAVARQQHQRRRHGLEGVAEPDAHQDRHARGRELGGGVERREAGDGDDDEADAGQDAFGSGVAGAPRWRRDPAALRTVCF
jgi:hypothetical protein